MQAQTPVQAPPTQVEPPAPGALNYVEGQVSANGQTLTPQSVGHFSLQVGQTLGTGNGHAEVLLTPGTFLRVGPNSQFRMTSIGLADARITLVQGTALIEADQLVKGSHVEVTMGNTSVDLLKKGLYEFTANPPSTKVLDGQAEVVDLANRRKIGKHDQVSLANNPNLKKTSFDEKQEKQDELYVWSEARSQSEAAQNQLVAQNSIGYTPVGNGWFWDPYTNHYGFWPAAYVYNPFGFGFYGGFYPGFYEGYWGGYRRGFIHPRLGWRGDGGVGAFRGIHGNGVAGFHGGGFHGGGFHGGGHR